MATKGTDWTPSDTKRLAITVIGGVLASIAAAYAMDWLRRREPTA